MVDTSKFEVVKLTLTDILSQRDHDILLAMQFFSQVDMEKYSGVSRNRWREELNRIRHTLSPLVCQRAGSVDPILSGIYRELVTRIEKSEGLETETETEKKEICISNFTQIPQPSLKELVTEVKCLYQPGIGGMYHTFELKDGLRVRVKEISGYVEIDLDPEKLQNINLQNYKLLFGYKSKDVFAIIIKLRAVNGRELANYQYNDINLGYSKDIVIDNLVKCMAQVVIQPLAEGVFSISNMRLVPNDEE